MVKGRGQVFGVFSIVHYSHNSAFFSQNWKEKEEDEGEESVRMQPRLKVWCEKRLEALTHEYTHVRLAHICVCVCV
jgi:hypothetical protein